MRPDPTSRPAASLAHLSGPLLLALALSLAACGNPGGDRAEVVAADGVLCDLSRKVAGPDLRVACLLKPGDNPHQFQLQPSHKDQLSSARLVLINGYGLTPALAKLPGVVAIAEEAVPESVRLNGEHIERAEHGGDQGDQVHDHEGHVHGDRDPHVWNDPRQAAAMTTVIAQRFSRLRPEGREAFERRAALMRERLLELHAWNRSQLATVPAPAPPLASPHRGFASFAAAYGLRELSLVDAFSSSENLRPEALQGVLTQLQELKVPKLFTESSPPEKALMRISEISGVPIVPDPVVADGLSPSSEPPGSLMATLVRNTCIIVRGWGGRCDQAAGESLVQRWSSTR